jgi:hypothetical protein
MSHWGLIHLRVHLSMSILDLIELLLVHLEIWHSKGGGREVLDHVWLLLTCVHHVSFLSKGHLLLVLIQQPIRVLLSLIKALQLL